MATSCTLRPRAVPACVGSVVLGAGAGAAGKAKEAHTMSVRDGPARWHHEVARHEIRVQGHLDDRWADWVDGLTFTQEGDGTTTLTGPLADQAALHGLLRRVRDLG